MRELERQIGSMLYERLAKSRDEAAVKAFSSQGLIIENPADANKHPKVLEFLGLEERTHWHERDWERVIIFTSTWCFTAEVMPLHTSQNRADG